MAAACQIAGCKAEVPAELAGEHMCPQHYTLEVESRCAEMRRATATVTQEVAKREEILHYLTITGERLARVAIGNARLADEMKARILNTFLTLMNLRESVDRSTSRPNPWVAPQVSAGRR